MRLLYDTTDIPATSIPLDAEMVAGYIDGHYRSFSAVVARCPNAVHVPIAVFPSTNDGLVLDCETGDATPAQCPGWIKMRRAAGIERPTIYTLLTWAGDVKSRCAAAGLVLGREWALWVAHYDGRPVPDGVGEVAKQYVNHGPHGENCDISAVFDDAWPYVSPRPAPATPHLWPFEEEPMSYPKPVPNDGIPHSVPLPPPHAGACQGGYGKVWLSFSWDNFDTPIDAVLKARVLAVGFDESLTPLNPTDIKVDWTTLVPKTRWHVEVPDGTASVTATIVEVPAGVKDPTKIEMVPMVEAEVKGKPA